MELRAYDFDVNNDAFFSTAADDVFLMPVVGRELDAKRTTLVKSKTKKWSQNLKGVLFAEIFCFPSPADVHFWVFNFSFQKRCFSDFFEIHIVYGLLLQN